MTVSKLLMHSKQMLLVIFIVGIELAAVLYFSRQSPQPIEGATLVDTASRCTQIAPVGEACSDNSEYMAAELPTLYRDRHAPSHLVMTLKAELAMPPRSADIFALYLPKIADAVWIKVNGQLIYESGDINAPPVRHWSRPVFASVPSVLLGARNTVEIVTTGYPQEGTGLHPFYFGPAEVLEGHYLLRVFFTEDMAIIGFALMVLSALAFCTLIIASPKVEEYRWLALVSTAAPVFALNYAVIVPPFSFVTWTIVWSLTLHVFVCGLYRFSQSSLGDAPKPFERRYWMVVVFFTFALVFGPKEYLLEMVGVLGIVTGVIVALGLLRHVRYYHRDGFFVFFVPFFSFSMALAAGISDLMFFYLRPSPVNVQAGHLALPLIMGVAAWQILRDLTRSMRQNEDLNRRLLAKVEAASEALEASYDELAEVRQLEMLDKERQRIMFELHDGVAGHLVNTLAYMQSHPAPDVRVQEAIEGALQDLALMIDSHELHDSLAASLGMLRARLEPLLGRAGVSFNWQIEEELEAPVTGPSLVLNVLRIVQEAVTNSVKHANATLITVKMDRKSVIVSDNGAGQKSEVADRPDGINGGFGIPNMKKRARNVSADFDIEMTPQGTTITLSWR
ncbi:MAG: ATP-binding protein [Sulfitobacter sp.]